MRVHKRFRFISESPPVTSSFFPSFALNFLLNSFLSLTGKKIKTPERDKNLQAEKELHFALSSFPTLTSEKSSLFCSDLLDLPLMACYTIH